MNTEKTRIIFFAETVTLAHMARCIVLADALHATGQYTIALAADSRYDSILGELAYQRIPLHSVSSEYFAQQLAKGSPLYTTEILSGYVEDDLQILDDFRPDCVFGDFRLSLAISCPLRKIPFATITNAYWSPYADISYPIPEMLLVKIFGVTLAQKMFDLVRPIVFYLHAVAFNKTRKKYTLAPLAYDLREVYTYADYTLYADSEAVIPMLPYPDNHVFIGPVLWSAKVDYPDWWDSLPLDKPVVFVTLGSSGNAELLPLLLKALSYMPLSVICITANKIMLEKKYDNVFSANFLPSKSAVQRADVVICNGGSPMVYQSLLETTPVIGLPGNLDQYLMMSIVAAAGKGDLIRAGKANTNNICAAVNRAINGTGSSDGKAMETVYDNLDKIEALIERGIANKAANKKG